MDGGQWTIDGGLLTMKEETLQIIEEIKAFYKEFAPSQYQDGLIDKPGEQKVKDLEEAINLPLPEAYRFFLFNNDFQVDFDANFKCLSVKEVLSCWEGMHGLLDKGVFNDGRIEHHEKGNFGNWDGDFIKKVWWSPKWIPFAEDSCGNMKCIDCDPGKNGVMHQLMAMEVQDGQGPFIESRYVDFFDYLSKHLVYLQKGQYTLDHDYWDSSPMIEIDSYIKPK